MKIKSYNNALACLCLTAILMGCEAQPDAPPSVEWYQPSLPATLVDPGPRPRVQGNDVEAVLDVAPRLAAALDTLRCRMVVMQQWRTLYLERELSDNSDIDKLLTAVENCDEADVQRVQGDGSED